VGQKTWRQIVKTTKVKMYERKQTGASQGLEITKARKKKRDESTPDPAGRKTSLEESRGRKEKKASTEAARQGGIGNP